MTITFDKGQPFKPYEQLMGVFPTSRYGFIVLQIAQRLILVNVTVGSTFLRSSIH